MAIFFPYGYIFSSSAQMKSNLKISTSVLKTDFYTWTAPAGDPQLVK